METTKGGRIAPDVDVSAVHSENATSSHFLIQIVLFCKGLVRYCTWHWDGIGMVTFSA